MFPPNPVARRRNRGPRDGYQNKPMPRAEAVNLALDAGLLLSDRDDRGNPIARTTRVDIRPNGEGYDLVIPAEHVKRLADVGRDQIIAVILAGE